MPPQYSICDLEDLGALRLRGADVVRFLQGQLSSDVRRLCAERSLPAGYHNSQGRVIALLRLVHLEEGDVLALLPRELLAAVAQRLAKFVLRAKVTLTEDSARWHVGGLARGTCEQSDPEPAALPASVHAQQRLGATRVVCIGERPARWLVLRPRECEPPGPAAGDRGGELPAAVPAGREHWRELDVRAGLPQVYAATSEQFVAQMLNLDAIGAIDFEKGCYTGQEVIARAHYRGRVKRRLQRLRSRAALELSPGDGGTLPDGRAFTVVEAVRLADGRCEFLAVAPLPGAPGQAHCGETVDVEALPLPYPVPD